VQMVFDALGVPVGGVFIHSDHLEKVSQNTMPVVHILCNSHAGFCEAYAPVSLVVYMAALIQPLKHFGHTGGADVEVVRDVNGSSIAFPGYQLINNFKIVLHAGRPGNLLDVVGITDGLKAIPSSSSVVAVGCMGFILEFSCQLHHLRDLYNNKYYSTVKKSCSILNLVISTSRLHSMLEDRNLLIVDTRPFTSYAESHIPGAVNTDLMQFHWIDTSKSGISQFNRQSRLLLSNIGVSKKKFVVFYDDVSGTSAARGVWLSLYFSHNKVAMLDGGLTKWKAEGYKTESKTNPFVHSNFKGKPNPKVLADFVHINSLIKSKKSFIIDTRSKDEYDGSAIRAAHAGHIPTAINIDWNDNLDHGGGVFKSYDKLGQMYSYIPKDAEVTTYCQGGYRAANSFVALKMLGYKNVRMYLGSWGEWGNRLDLPAETKKPSGK
jgi:thiosulfate/3-mercaptopyruvate sulfurtransferase